MAPRILTLANQKGGVGKTTTAINLATALAAIGERVLIVDLDPQGNASTGLGISRAGRDVSSYDLLVGEARIAEAAVMTTVPNVAIVPSTMDLLGIELTIAGAPRTSVGKTLRDALPDWARDASFLEARDLLHAHDLLYTGNQDCGVHPAAGSVK